MLIDFSNAQKDTQHRYDVCIAGSGPAGITLALRLAEKGKKVALLEAGGMTYSAPSQDIYAAQSTGMELWPTHMRLRYFGGTSNHWTGRCKPFEDFDFRERTVNGLPGWPIRYSEVEPYLAEAMNVLDMGGAEFEPVPSSPDSLSGAFKPDIFALSPPTRFGTKHLETLKQSSQIDLYINANLVDIRLMPDGETVEHFVISDYDGNTAAFPADDYIVATGGIENARLLLNCDKQDERGIGNSTGMLGKCFMEHYQIDLGTFVIFDEDLPDSFQYHNTEAFSDKHTTGNANLTLSRVAETKAYGRTAGVKRFLQNLSCDLGLEEKLQFFLTFKCPGDMKIGTLIEQFPYTGSFIGLSDETDALGLRRPHINWAMSDADKHTIRTTSAELAKEFADAGLGRIKLKDYVVDSDLEIPVSPHAHHMGSTRMSADPEHGVVDTNCRVHGTKNLYIAGSSIFATGGSVNPTMPLIQFALRLADHIARTGQDSSTQDPSVSS